MLIRSIKNNKSIIGDIQAFGDSKKKRDADEDDYVKLTDKEIPFHIIESYKSIRTNLSFALSTVEKKIFAVSYSNPGEGKSTTSANIAIAMAQGGNRVLLINVDMRKSDFDQSLRTICIRCYGADAERSERKV